MAHSIRSHEVSSTELVAAHLSKIREINPQLNACVEIFVEEAMARAEHADTLVVAGAELGPLHGVPFSVKDCIDVEGHRTTAGTYGRRSSPSAIADATLVARLRKAGAIPICKTNLPDLLFAYESDNLIFGRSNNPYDLGRTPGGSSGGEAALIAACGSPLGLGSDAAGSVRVPAAFCGIASIKPTSGRLPRTGHVPPPGGWIEALWQIGPMARHVEDLELAMYLLAGTDGLDFGCAPKVLDQDPAFQNLRLAFFTDNRFATCDSAVQNTVRQAAETLRLAGIDVHEVTPPGVEEAFELEMGLLGTDGADGIDQYLLEVGSEQQHPLLHQGFLDRLRPLRSSMGEFAKLWGRWDKYRNRMAEFFLEYDAVLSPVYTETALLHGASAEAGKFEGFSYTMAWNVSGNPAAVVRCGEIRGLPINVQVVTPWWREMRALQICRMLEERLGGWRESPLFPTGPIDLIC